MKSINWGSKVILLAKALGKTISDLEKDLPCPHTTMHRIVNEGQEPKMSFYRKLLRICPNLNQNWWFLDEGDIFVEDVEKRIFSMVIRENELYQKLEVERDRNMKVDSVELMDVFKRNHAILGSLEQGFSQMRKDIAEIKEKVAISE